MFTVHENLSSLGTVEGEMYLPPERRVRTSLPAIDSFFPGFRSSQIALIDSSDKFLFDLTHLLCVNAISDLGEEVVWVDGGNSINPYEIASLCRRFRLDMRETLDSVNIARAFTAYQMTSLIVDKLEREVERTRSGTVIVSCFTDLFHDKDMWWSESFQLIKRCLSSLREMTERHSLVTIVTNYGLTKIGHKRSLSTLMEESADSILRIENRKRVLELSLVKEGRIMLYHPVPYYQTTLDEFLR
ncbi:MAG: hypothetical protein GKC03_04510 [Methanomassiliicoccales archaeon]|nr:hypothetical protein [Methanomassiliicoccales archaeon]NYT15712.1 hypothetical protein [Methanomassiliicoccales archaeon]